MNMDIHYSWIHIGDITEGILNSVMYQESSESCTISRDLIIVTYLPSIKEIQIVIDGMYVGDMQMNLESLNTLGIELNSFLKYIL